MKKIAIFGGTFNPIHLGHIKMLEDVSKRNDIEKILVMPVNIPPHKSARVVSAEHRLNMCKLAIQGIPNAEICDYEINLKGKSYTVNTLEHLAETGIKMPYWIIGADSLVNFHLWYRYEDILKISELLVYKRGNVSDEEIDKSFKILTKKGAKIVFTDAAPPNISSTYIRTLLKSGKSAYGLLSKSVEDYIFKNRLYSEENL